MSHDEASVFKQNDRLNRSRQDLNKGGRCDVHRDGSPASITQVSVIGKTLTSMIFYTLNRLDVRRAEKISDHNMYYYYYYTRCLPDQLRFRPSTLAR